MDEYSHRIPITLIRNLQHKRTLINTPSEIATRHIMESQLPCVCLQEALRASRKAGICTDMSAFAKSSRSRSMRDIVIV
jgi:hypothetical protein